MFYVKKSTADGTVVKLPLKTNNVYALCPGCGKEVPIDWLKLMLNSPHDIKCITIYCDECKNKILFMQRLRKKGE